MTEHSSQIATETEIDSGLVALPGVELLIQDGEICVRSPALASGLYRNGALEPLSFRSGYFSTGDLGEIHDGKLFIHGRASEVISSGGKKIYPAEVEAELAVTPGVSDCAVLGLPDPEWGEIACAAIVEKMPGSFDPTRAKNALNASLESFKAPKRWAILPKIPRTPSGKVIRAELRAVLEAYFKSSRS
jgi:acyl-CoA synthetase (AMP-forming)/AMP-acid ligase II